MTPFQVVYKEEGSTYYWKGNNTHKVPMELFVENRRRLCDYLRDANDLAGEVWIYLEGGTRIPLYNTDIPAYPFRQESFFMWAFGVELPDCIGLIDFRTSDAYLFIPRVQDEDSPLFGSIPTLDEYKYCFEMTDVYYKDDLWQFLRNKPSTNVPTLLTLSGVNSASGATFKSPTFPKNTWFNVREDLLYDAMCELRMLKTAHEIDVMRYVAQVTSNAHKAVMKYVRPGKKEYQCEAVFCGHVYREGGCRHLAYMPVCSSGTNASPLFYGWKRAPNDGVIYRGLCLFTMGASYFGYVSSVCCTFPANGVFKPNEILIYDTVLKCRDFILSNLKPGASLPKIQIEMNNLLLNELKNLGILRGTIEEMNAVDLIRYFQPHGIAEFIGLDFHDVGGHLCEPVDCSKAENLKHLRAACVLRERMVLSIVSACYFIPKLIDSLIKNYETSRLVNESVLIDFVKVGSVRIKDIVLITYDGHEVLSDMPLTVEEIETFMRSN